MPRLRMISSRTLNFAYSFTHDSTLEKQEHLMSANLCQGQFVEKCSVLTYSVSQKNIPDISSCKSRKHYRIFIMFGTHVTEKLSNQ